MKQTLWVGIAAAAWLALGVRSAAHHSFAAEFDISQPVTLTGVLTRMEWINPHGWVYVEVKNGDGTPTTWAVETGAPNSLQRRGFRRTDFPVGVEVRVTGYRAKSGKAVANVRVAVNHRVRQGEAWVDGEPAFYDITVWEKAAENAAESFGKGDRVLFAGQVHTEAWTDSSVTIRCIVWVFDFSAPSRGRT